MRETTIVRKGQTGEAGNSGEFGHKTHTTDFVELTFQPGDRFENLTETESKQIVANLFANIDQAWETERKAQESRDEIADGEAAGQAHATAEAIAFILSDRSLDVDYETAGEEMLNARRTEGFDLEHTDGWTGPGEIDAIDRASAVEHLRGRAEELAVFTDAELGLPADTVAFFQGRAEGFRVAADTLAGAI